MYSIIFGLLTAIFPALGKWLPNPDRELGHDDIIIKTNQSTLKQVKEANEIRNQNSSLSDDDVVRKLHEQYNR